MNSESSSYNAKASSGAKGAADEVRRAFAALPFDSKVSTLFRIELDMVGDVTDAVIAAASRCVDEMAQAFSCSDASAPAKSSSKQPSS